MPTAGAGPGSRGARWGSRQGPLVKPRAPGAAPAGPASPAQLLGAVGRGAGARRAPCSQLRPGPSAGISGATHHLVIALRLLRQLGQEHARVAAALGHRLPRALPLRRGLGCSAGLAMGAPVSLEVCREAPAAAEGLASQRGPALPMRWLQRLTCGGPGAPLDGCAAAERDQNGCKRPRQPLAAAPLPPLPWGALARVWPAQAPARGVAWRCRLHRCRQPQQQPWVERRSAPPAELPDAWTVLSAWNCWAWNCWAR